MFTKPKTQFEIRLEVRCYMIYHNLSRTVYKFVFYVFNLAVNAFNNVLY